MIANYSSTWRPVLAGLVGRFGNARHRQGILAAGRRLSVTLSRIDETVDELQPGDAAVGFVFEGSELEGS